MRFIWGVILGLTGLVLIANKIRDNRDLDKGLNIVGTIAVIVSALLVLFSIIVVIPAGHVGVVDIFGRVRQDSLKPGINLVNPFARVVLFSAKTHEVKEVMEVPSKEGLTVSLDVSALYRLNPEMASTVYRTVGLNYEDVVLVPQFRSAGRGVTVNYEAKALYTSGREMIARQLHDDLQKLVEDRGIIVENVLLRSIKLPATVSAAIEQKLKAEQEAEQMRFVLLKEEQEAERKRIEAEGIRNFQQIVTQGITPSLLEWKGIEATEKLAQSPNAKVVIIGNNENGLPLIFNTN